MSHIVLTPKPDGSTGYLYVARMSSGAFRWGRLGEAERFTDEQSARAALAGMSGWGWEPLKAVARVMRVGENGK